MPNLDPVHDHAGSAAISSDGHIPGAADPSYTIDEDDRIGALIEAHSELTASVLRTLGHLTTAVEGMSRAVESLAARLDTLTVSDGAGPAPVDAHDEERRRSFIEEYGRPFDLATAGRTRLAIQVFARIVEENIPDVFILEGFPAGDHGDTQKYLIPMRGGASVTIYQSGKATTGGKDEGLRASLRAILRAEGFDVRC